MKKYDVLTLDIEKDEPSFVNDKAKWWLIDKAGDYCLYRVLTNEGDSTYIGVRNSTKQVVAVTQSYEAAMVALDFHKEAERFK